MAAWPRGRVATSSTCGVVGVGRTRDRAVTRADSRAWLTDGLGARLPSRLTALTLARRAVDALRCVRPRAVRVAMLIPSGKLQLGRIIRYQIGDFYLTVCLIVSIE